MNFFGRENEIKELQEIRDISQRNARFTIVTGRRRSGKTSLLLKAYLKDKAEHFFHATGRFKKYHIEYKGLSMEDM